MVVHPSATLHAAVIAVDDRFPAASTAATTGAVPLFSGPSISVSAAVARGPWSSEGDSDEEGDALAAAAAAAGGGGNGGESSSSSSAAGPPGHELWAMVLEKALAKVHGGCVAALSSVLCSALVYLCDL